MLIVGGGPVGLALGIELGRLGVPTTLVEARDGTIKSPKMNFVNVRTMEFVRRWGLTGEVRSAGHPESFHPNVIWVTSVTGHEIARLELPPFSEEKTRFFSPAADCLVSQLWFDPVLLAHARRLRTLVLRHRTRLDAFREVADGVEADLTDLVSGARETITASYIVGCDGAQSSVRGALGVDLEGLPRIEDHFHVFFHSTELLEIFEKGVGQARFCHLVGPEGPWGMITSINWRGLWRFGVEPPPGDESAVPELLRRAVGRDFQFELLDASHWESRELVATAYRRGRAFLAGDAAHQNTPNGGFGMNTGIGDAIDLAWKLWGTLAGWGGPGLLASYEDERRPVAKRNAQEATSNFLRERKLAANEGIDADGELGERQRSRYRQFLFGEADIRRHHDTDGIALGYHYERSPIVVPDGTEEPPDTVSDYLPTARPGHRAPHAWLDGGPPPSAGLRLDGARSTLDLFGNGFVLMSLGPASGTEAFAHAAGERGVPLLIEEISEPHIAELYGRRFVLVRPDGQVAWRGDRLPTDAGEIIDRVRGAL